MIAFLKREPAVVLGAIEAAIALTTSFGVQLSAEQVGSILALSAAALSLLLRQVVTPVIK